MSMTKFRQCGFSTMHLLALEIKRQNSELINHPDFKQARENWTVKTPVIIDPDIELIERFLADGTI